MKICFLAPASVIHTVRWVNSMDQRGNEVYLITMHPPKLDMINKDVKIINLKHSAPLGYYSNFMEVRKILKRINPDIINTHYASGYGTLSRLVRFSPTLLSVWGSDVYDFPNESVWKRKILQKNLAASTQIASTSNVMKDQTLKYIKPEKSIAVTPFGVDINKFAPGNNKDETFITIGLVKKLEEKYGVKYLIMAVSKLIEMLERNDLLEISNRIRLLIVGEGSQYKELVALTKSLNLYSISTFTGAVSHEEVPVYLNKLDIYCAPSTLDSESFGVAIIEASSCELPVIVTDVGGLPEVVEVNETGFVVENKNVEQIAEKLYELVLNKEKRNSLGKRGRRRVESLYNWDKNVELMESVYYSLIEEKKHLKN
ncbi:glycosyltransferase [Rossellomorea vietnamensis]|uniref:Glycosyltransferase n=1 Tax=Rossellomorea vietnamensis TaxID=218284 RepID=A0A6I6UJZ7_9BACI|nr:glycosyltransferase [Rossellomorea vietnamensis]QHE63335.1 glycosyltransferase [Rossellomorea vietnamensis]